MVRALSNFAQFFYFFYYLHYIFGVRAKEFRHRPNNGHSIVHDSICLMIRIGWFAVSLCSSPRSSSLYFCSPRFICNCYLLPMARLSLQKFHKTLKTSTPTFNPSPCVILMHSKFYKRSNLRKNHELRRGSTRLKFTWVQQRQTTGLTKVWERGCWASP